MLNQCLHFIVELTCHYLAFHQLTMRIIMQIVGSRSSSSAYYDDDKGINLGCISYEARMLHHE